MKNILVPTDFSDNAKDALRYALNFVGEGGQLHVVSVLSMPPSTSGTTGSLAVRMKEKAQEDMQNLVESMQHEGVVFNPIIREGSTVNTILSMGEEFEADLIIMGTKGSTGLESIFMGSVASSVVEKSKIPVISVPKGSEFNGLKRVLYATDLKQSGSEALRNLLAITGPFSPRVDILHIYPEGQEAPVEALEALEKEITSELENNNIRFHAHPHNSIADGLVAFMDASETELLAMVTRKRNLIQKLFDRSLTKRLAMSSKVPLISFQLA